LTAFGVAVTFWTDADSDSPSPAPSSSRDKRAGGSAWLELNSLKEILKKEPAGEKTGGLFAWATFLEQE
jgi:hypothetical protein